MIGNRLHMARKAQGLSMQALAGKVGLSANMIKKYEHNQSMPSSDVLIRLIHVLDVDMAFLFRPTQVELKQVEYRKKANTPKLLLDKITADVTNQAERWLHLKELWLGFPIATYQLDYDFSKPITTIDDIEIIVDELRAYWKLGINPIPNMIDFLESLGIIVIISDVDNHDNKFDGLQAMIDDTPIIVISSHWTGDRQRFTLAHELGHLVLEKRIPKNMDIEKACNRFAGAFLLPKESLIQEWGEKRTKITPNELSFLKHEYGISMSAILYRVKDLHIITDNYHKNQSIRFRQKGWHKQEPDNPYPNEKTHLFEQLVYRAIAENIISESKGAELLGISTHKLVQQQYFDMFKD